MNERRIRTRTVLLVVSIIVIGGAVWYWRQPLWGFFSDRERIQTWVMGFGPWGPLASISLDVAQVLFAPVPGQFVGLANGYLYGVWLGTLYSMTGLLIGTTLAMSLGRWFGRPLVERLVDSETLVRWDRITDQRGPIFFFLVFLFPLLPDDVACFLIGLSSLSIPRMLILLMPARLPGVVVSCWVGAHATEVPWWAWFPLGGGVAALAWLFWRYQSDVERRMVDLIERIGQRVRRKEKA